ACQHRREAAGSHERGPRFRHPARPRGGGGAGLHRGIPLEQRRPTVRRRVVPRTFRRARRALSAGLLACAARARTAAASRGPPDDRRFRAPLPAVLLPARADPLRRFLSLCMGWLHPGTGLLPLSLPAASRRANAIARHRVLAEDQPQGADFGLSALRRVGLPRPRPPSSPEHGHLQTRLPRARSRDLRTARPAAANSWAIATRRRRLRLASLTGIRVLPQRPHRCAGRDPDRPGALPTGARATGRGGDRPRAGDADEALPRPTAPGLRAARAVVLAARLHRHGGPRLPPGPVERRQQFPPVPDLPGRGGVRQRRALPAAPPPAPGHPPGKRGLRQRCGAPAARPRAPALPGSGRARPVRCATSRPTADERDPPPSDASLPLVLCLVDSAADARAGPGPLPAAVRGGGCLLHAPLAAAPGADRARVVALEAAAELL
ncbi:MAG: hypothetical protein AVDCRST_MAG18-3764, partial [uncultured Thermomicrobiales bacterium]